MSRLRTDTTTTRERAQARAARKPSPWRDHPHCDTPKARASHARLRANPYRKPSK